MNQGFDPLSLIIGLLLGTFCGCCGIVIAMVFSRRDYLPGAIIGFVLQSFLSLVLGLVSNLEKVGFEQSLPDVPWDLVGVFVVIVGSASILAAAGLWAFGGTDDDEDDGFNSLA
ncbi:MAG: hypothetical protein AAGA48_35285 [Myxococcota bacterium]